MIQKHDARSGQRQAISASFRKRGVASVYQQVGMVIVALLAMAVIVETGGTRSLFEQYLKTSKRAASARKLSVPARVNETLQSARSQATVLGANFRTRPQRKHAEIRATSIPSPSARLLISEVQACNAGEIVDWEGGCPDWIELWNPGEHPFDATGWYLTDTLDEPQKWRMPELILSPNERILVFASGYDFVDKEELHTNFRIAKTGELLHLVRPDKSTVEQTIAVGGLNVTHGVTFGPSASEPQPLAYPTPLQPNAPEAVGFTKAVECSHASCLFQAAFTITLACETPDAVIRYTTDGSVPEATHGKRYRHPITIDRTTVVRARAFGNNRYKSAVLTRSFLNRDELVHQSANPARFPARWNQSVADYEMDPQLSDTRDDSLQVAVARLPIVSVVGSTAAIFGRDGIYSNPKRRGRKWEIPAVMELLSHRDEAGFQAPCGLRLAGSKNKPTDGKKRSLRISFRSRYGLAALQHAIFPSMQVAAPNRGTGPLREPAVPLLEYEDVLIDRRHGLQSQTTGRFHDVRQGTYGDAKTKYLWTIDARGINLVREATPFPTPRGCMVHSNLSQTASLGGEVWFESTDRVRINDESGRFGVAAGMTRAQWDAAIRYWEDLGYQVHAIPSRGGCSSLLLCGTDDFSEHYATSKRSRAQYLRDEWIRETEQAMGRLAPRGRFVHVCVNGLYWGLYSLVERPDEEYLAHRLGGSDDSYIAMRMKKGKIYSDQAGTQLWDKITELAAADLRDRTHFAALQEHLDVIDFIDYSLVQMYVRGTGWMLHDANTMRAYRRKFLNARLRFMHWNAESAFASDWKRLRVDEPFFRGDNGKPGELAHLFRRLLTSEVFRQLFAARVEKWCGQGGVLGVAACQRRYADLVKQLEPVLIADAARWGDVYFDEPDTPLEHWQKRNKHLLENWFPNRTRDMLKELAACGLWVDGGSSRSTATEMGVDERAAN